MTSTVNPILPNELILRVFDHTVPSALEIDVVVADDDRMKDAVANFLHQTNIEVLPQIAITNSSEWRSTRALLNLNFEIASLTGRRSTIEWPSTLNVGFDNVVQRSSVTNSAPDMVLAKFKLFTATIPIVIRYGRHGRRTLIGKLVLKYERSGQGWTHQADDAAWISITGGESEARFSAAGLAASGREGVLARSTNVLANGINHGLPNDLPNSSLSLVWLSRFRKHVEERISLASRRVAGSDFVPRGFNLRLFAYSLERVSTVEKNAAEMRARHPSRRVFGRPT
ncbi:unnamed protein product [Zymoseptoria tritici ST99CH_1A5]|uniref:Uncharacterized protein n=4 Tax=Zymoseptoria tritici TaxID=1047171 RepID=F9XF70_ZYMTI|nr:uncharacterized protein MYCGRDRAFT_94797 [Zymoseptoria tritici IPO323]EGP85943.1 hypothetical protein MYCGRDRAFT_94797 [Zymoseptoria tritici IPO323]SMQ52908.1 unnamed protein product [Zymoseptoria tritici ST99CH_3D7]SMR55735.1 unnamed protein product [Zymoseptoria tritici ST99CH_1E4]SMY26539.1 unnamed protein product [Zymoseptoria tritici ST99CH_1A5]